MFVSNEKQCQGEKLSAIYSAMVGRHKFRHLHIETLHVKVIIKDIDTLITTNMNEEVTLRQMILDLEPKNKKYGDQKLFHSIDYTTEASSVWFRNKTIDGKGKGYILSYFKWDKAEALHVSDGLGLYVGQKFGKTGVYDYFLESHWIKVAKWKYNKFEDTWETPEEVAMADNVINDPMAAVMQAYIDTQRAELPKEITLIQEEKQTSTQVTGKTAISFSGSYKSKSSDTVRKQLDNDENIEDAALSVAYSIRSGGKNADDKVDDDKSEGSTFSELAKKRAATIYQAEQDNDLDSLDRDSAVEKNVRKVVQDDNISHASSLTDLTDNTRNQTYHNPSGGDSTGSVGSSLSIKSLKIADLQNIITADMTPEEINQSITTAVQLSIKRTKERALKVIENAQQIQKQKSLLVEQTPDSEDVGGEITSTDKVRGRQKPDNELNDQVESDSVPQSSSNCNAAQGP